MVLLFVSVVITWFRNGFVGWDDIRSVQVQVLSFYWGIWFVVQSRLVIFWFV